MQQQLNIDEIMSLLPHRYPFLLLDKVIDLKLNESIVGIKNVTFNEQYFVGHFPNNPVMPGVLIIEALAQVSAVLVSKSMETTKNKDVYLLSIETAKFRKVVRPGDTLYLHSKIEQGRSSVWKCLCKAEVNNEIVAECIVTAMVKSR